MGANFYAKDNIIDPKIREFHGNIWVDTVDSPLTIDNSMSLYIGAVWSYANVDAKADYSLWDGFLFNPRILSAKQIDTTS